MAGEAIKKEDILEFLRKNKDFFKTEFDVDNIILFGSYARDEAMIDSNIDILIESKTKSFDFMYRVKVFIQDGLKKNVFLSYFDSVHPFIMRHIKEELIYA